MLLWTYASQLAGDDNGWWKMSTERAAVLLEGEHWWLDAPGIIPRQTLLIDTTAILVYGLARSHDESPATISGRALMGWAEPCLAPLKDLAEQGSLLPTDETALRLWRQRYAERQEAIVQQLAYLLFAAGHRLPTVGEPATERDPVISLWTDLVRPPASGHRYASLAAPALPLGLAVLIGHFERPAHQR